MSFIMFAIKIKVDYMQIKCVIWKILMGLCPWMFYTCLFFNFSTYLCSYAIENVLGVVPLKFRSSFLSIKYTSLVAIYLLKASVKWHLEVHTWVHGCIINAYHGYIIILWTLGNLIYIFLADGWEGYVVLKIGVDLGEDFCGLTIHNVPLQPRWYITCSTASFSKHNRTQGGAPPTHVFNSAGITYKLSSCFWCTTKTKMDTGNTH